MIQAACSAGTGGVLLPKVVDGTLRLPSQPASRPGCSLKIPPTQESEITLPSSAAACLPPPPGPPNAVMIMQLIIPVICKLHCVALRCRQGLRSRVEASLITNR